MTEIRRFGTKAYPGQGYAELYSDYTKLEQAIAEADEYLPDACGPYQTLGERTKLLKDQMEYAAESSGEHGRALTKANDRIAELEQAYRDLSRERLAYGRTERNKAFAEAALKIRNNTRGLQGQTGLYEDIANVFVGWIVAMMNEGQP